MAPAWLRDPHEVGAGSVAAMCLTPPAWLSTGAALRARSLCRGSHADRVVEADGSYQLDLDGEPFAITIDDGQVHTARRGHSPNPRCAVTREG
jgi:putative intracellular protease/amidase